MAEAHPEESSLTSSPEGTPKCESDVAKLQRLINLSFVKISLFKNLLKEESTILNHDFSDEELKPMLKKQIEVVERAMKSIESQEKSSASIGDGEEALGTSDSYRSEVSIVSGSPDSKPEDMGMPPPGEVSPISGARTVSVGTVPTEGVELRMDMAETTTDQSGSITGTSAILDQNDSPPMEKQMSRLVSMMTTLNLKSLEENEQNVSSPAMTKQLSRLASMMTTVNLKSLAYGENTAQESGSHAMTKQTSRLAAMMTRLNLKSLVENKHRVCSSGEKAAHASESLVAKKEMSRSAATRNLRELGKSTQLCIPEKDSSDDEIF